MDITELATLIALALTGIAVGATLNHAFVMRGIVARQKEQLARIGESLDWLEADRARTEAEDAE